MQLGERVTAQVVSNGAIIVGPKDPQALAEAIINLSKGENLSKNLSKRGIERSQAFSWSKIAEETLEVYLEVYRGQQVT